MHSDYRTGRRILVQMTMVLGYTYIMFMCTYTLQGRAVSGVHYLGSVETLHSLTDWYDQEEQKSSGG